MNAVAESPDWLGFVSVVETGRTPYSLSVAARLAAVQPDLLQHYCRIGLLGETRTNAAVEPVFDDNALYAVRRMENLREHHGVSLRALAVVCDQAREIERLHGELRSLRAG